MALAALCTFSIEADLFHLVEFARQYQYLDAPEQACNQLYEDIAAVTGPWFTKKRHNNWIDKWRRKKDAAKDREGKIGRLCTSSFLSALVTLYRAPQEMASVGP